MYSIKQLFDKHVEHDIERASNTKLDWKHLRPQMIEQGDWKLTE